MRSAIGVDPRISAKSMLISSSNPKRNLFTSSSHVLQTSGFKVEGRNKSEYYVSVIARAYREAISLIREDGDQVTERIQKLMEEEYLFL